MARPEKVCMARHVGALAALAIIVALSAAGPGLPQKNNGPRSPVVEMVVQEVLVDPETESPVVVLVNEEEGLMLPIWIGVSEALAISNGLAGTELARPMTHDLLRNVILGLDATVSKVHVTTLKDNTFYASIFLLLHGTSIEIDSRPSDAIALALRLKAPIMVERSVIDEAGRQYLPFHTDRYGITVQALDAPLARLLGITLKEGMTGVVVSDVTPSSMASRDGLIRGDVIVEFDGKTTGTSAHLEAALAAALKEDRAFTLKVLRNGREILVRHPAQ